MVKENEYGEHAEAEVPDVAEAQGPPALREGDSVRAETEPGEHPGEGVDRPNTGEGTPDNDAEPSDVAPEERRVGSKETAEPKLVLPLAEMTPEERFRATTRLIFVAPDVPPIQPRSRRNELRQLDEMLDTQFSREERDSREPDQRDQRDSSSSRRRGRRRSGATPDVPPEEEQPRRSASRPSPLITEPQKLKGSTRLEAKKQRRRDGRDAGRRRTVITESEFLARREAVNREMMVRTSQDRIQIGVLEDRVLVEHYVARSSETSLIGNVYLGKVQNVLPSMEAAFVDIGRGRNAVLYSGEVDWSEFEGGNSARRIENALKPGDEVLVQVTKDPVGHKGARLTSQISLPGRFLVYVPGGAMNGISRKLPDTERARLKKILKEVLPNGAGVIVRTAAEGASEAQLTHDVQRLTRQWESIKNRVAKGGGPVLLHSEPDMLIKIIRDVFNEDFQKLVISGESTYGIIEEYLSQVAPELLERVTKYDGENDIFDEYRITEQIAKALDRKVWLPSGGSLVIDRTEAMTVVDVNTGKFVGSGGNLEETVTKNNLEAAEEIVRQLRLRDIGGIIVVDFIDMVLESNRDLVLRRMVECLSRDRTKHQVAEVTSLGLVQMTRKKLGLGLLESFSEPCEVCAGRGLIVHHEPVSKQRENGHGGRGRRGKGPNTAGNQAPQTHAISDGAKNMLAQVAASTIGNTKLEQSGAHDVGEANGPTESKATSSAGDGRPEGTSSSQTEPRRTRNRRATRDEGAGRDAWSSENSDDAAASQEPQDPSDLLSSVLEALPDAPQAGHGKARRRRVSTPQIRGGQGVGELDPKSAEQALEEALRATARAKDEKSE